MIELAERAVVRIDVTTRDGASVGSGFVVSKEGLVVTNYHVIEDALGAIVRFRDDSISEVQGAFFVDPQRDIAVIGINAASLGELQVLPISRDIPRKGERVIALGAPKGLSFSASEGMISGIRKGKDLVEELNKVSGLDADLIGTWVQTTTPISPGNSGGPLVSLQGEVVGVNTFYLRDGQNLNFAISAQDVRDAVEESRSASMKSFVDLAESSGGRAVDDDSLVDSELSTSANEFIASIAAEREERLLEIDKLDAEMEEGKSALKQAILKGDERAQREARQRIAKIARSINELIDAPLRTSVLPLRIERLETGQFGHFEGLYFEVLQVIDKDAGIALVIPISSQRERHNTVMVQGIDLSSVVDDELVTVPSRLLFEIAGTQTYSTVVGGTNTVFVLSCVGNTDQLKDGRLEARRRSPDEAPTLSQDERMQVETMRHSKMESQWAELREKLAEGMTQALRRELKEFSSEFKGQPQADAAENELQAAMQLHLATQFMKTGRIGEGKQRLREIVESWPTTRAAIDATKLLENGSSRGE